MVVPDFYVGRCHRGCRAAEHDDFAGRLQKVIRNLVRSPGAVPPSSIDSLCISARAMPRNAVQIGEEGIDDANIGRPRQVNSTLGLVLWCAMYPQPVEHEVICRILRFLRLN